MDDMKWNSRLPEVRKYRGNGEIIVLNNDITLERKDFRTIAIDNNPFSGYESIEFKNFTYSVSREISLSELSSIISDP